MAIAAPAACRPPSALARRTERFVVVGEQVRRTSSRRGWDGPRRTRWSRRIPCSARCRTLARRLVSSDCPRRAGRLCWQAHKRPDRLVAVARQVIAAVLYAQCAACGHGDLAGEMAGTGLGRSLALLDWRADVEAVYAPAELVLLMSDNEGMPVSLIEAGAGGSACRCHRGRERARGRGTRHTGLLDA